MNSLNIFVRLLVLSMLTYISADYIFPISSQPIKRGVIAISDGIISGVYESTDPLVADKPIKRYSGIIVPGFINTHCHLELSHLRGRIARETGLIEFIRQVIASRGKFSAEECREAMLQADDEMFRNGIVAVGDVSNTLTSRDLKLDSRLFYHTFVEVLGFSPDSYNEIYARGKELASEFSPLRHSIVPHAPYSVSRELMRRIGKGNDNRKGLLSIHNQESEEENKLFRYKTGGFIDFYKNLNINIDFFKAQARNSVQTYTHQLPENLPILLVHNTYTNAKDIYFIKRSGRNINFCFCPRANLYIENKLPDIQNFIGTGFNITLGTDSLASNDRLCIFSEIQTIQQNFTDISLEETICWATINGAKFLGIDHKYGSIEAGKRPGLNLITDIRNLSLTEESKVIRLL